mgnify:FL=1
MKSLTIEELLDEKALLYNVVDEVGNVLLKAGEILTPGKILQLRQIPKLYRLDAKNTSQNTEKIVDLNTNLNSSNVVFNEKSYLMTQVPRTVFSIDKLDTTNFNGVVNKTSKIDSLTQNRIKLFYTKILDAMKKNEYTNVVAMYNEIRDKIIYDIKTLLSAVSYFSQLKLLGEYSLCHSLNVGILSAALSYKLGLNQDLISDITLGALYHDIGKIYLPENVQTNEGLSSEEFKVYKSHPEFGYRILKEKLNIPENVAKIALNHHEIANGTGFPFGISLQNIDIQTSIVSVCNFFDNLTFNKTEYRVKNTREALKVMLQVGSSHFKAEVLYGFINMFSYNDTTPFEEMIL